ncbi:MAG: tetratricopeptide repeat protein [Thermodesulfobacteriota bacterium]
MAGKKKISKKELLKKPDEFITFSNRAFNWIKDHTRMTIAVVSGVILVVVFFFGLTTYQKRQDRLGHEKYFSALENGNPDQKLKKLEEVIGNYPRTKAAQTARVNLADLYYQKKDFPRAISAYQSALEKGKFSGDIKTLILGNLAYAYEQKGDLQQAVSVFSRISQEKESVIQEDSLLNLGRVYLKMGKKNEAKATYQNFIKTFPKSPYLTMVKDKLAGL